MPGRVNRKRPAVGKNEALDDEDIEAEDAQSRHRDEARHAPSNGEEAEDNADAASTHDLAKRLVRLALAHESQRRPLRRQDIGEKVLGNAGRQFKKVFAEAQHELRTVFGMEMAQLPAREKLTMAQKRAAQQKSTASKAQNIAWVIVSTLPPNYRTADLLQPPVMPDSESESIYTGLYSVLTALISLNGGMISESKMDRYLSRLSLEESTPLRGLEKTEILLKRMERENYLVKVREKIGYGGEEEVSWALGPRAKVEVSVKGLVRAVYGIQDEAGQEELEKKLERSLGTSVDAVPTDAVP